MTSDEAIAILQVYRPNGADREDPTFAEALKIARDNPMVREWFERQQSFDRQLSREHEATSAPADLRERILLATTAAALPPTSRERGWWRSPVPLILGAAASVLIVVTATVAFRGESPLPMADSALADFAISDAQHPKTHGGHGEEAANLNRALNKATTHLSDPLPANYASLHDTGCRTVKVDGRDVLEVCFKREGVGMHCYIARRDDFPRLTAPPKPTIEDKSGARIATWSDKVNLYIVVTKPGADALANVL